MPRSTIQIQDVSGLDAFIFDGTYLCDNNLKEEMSRCTAGQLLIKLDGLQRDRLHVTQALTDAYPLMTVVLTAMKKTEAKVIKILMIDFIYYVLQRNAFSDGNVVVPINQQMTDVRAGNLAIFPGTDRKDFRSTEVVPRYGISLGVTRFLPRSVTICKGGFPGAYNFKVTADHSRKMTGFVPATASKVYVEKIISQLISKDPRFLERDVEYQELCRTYFIAFPDECITECPPDIPIRAVQPPKKDKGRGKEHSENRKRMREEVLAKAAALPEGMRECKTCAKVLTVNNFEDKRLECKECRKDRRSTHDSMVVHDPETAMHPEKCSECGTAFEHDLFIPRGQGYRGMCRNCTNNKGYSEAYRVREREKDEDGYLERNAASHLEWAHRNPDALREQQRKQETEPRRAFLAILTSARARNINVEESSFDAMQIKLSLACHYCDYTPFVGDHLNGLDRIDSDAGYTDTNTVSCCSTCNFMKGYHEIDEFICNMHRIRDHHALAPPNAISRYRLPGFGGWSELRAAPKNEKRCFLSASQITMLCSSPCYLCGRGPSFGIDRLDSFGEYTEDNTRPCCSICNYAKKKLSLPEFLDHVAHVSAHTNAWVLKDVMDEPLRGNTSAVRQPVAMMSDDAILLLIFPSIGRAAAMINGLDENNVRQVLETGGKHLGYRWQRATPRMYRMQNCEQSVCNDILTFAST